MKVACSYFNNVTRLALVLYKLSVSHDVQVYPVRGTLVRTPVTVRGVGTVVEYLVFGSAVELPLLLTTDESYVPFHKQTIDYDLGFRDNIYVQALSLCCDKFITSTNPFQMECGLKGCTVVASAKKDKDITYTMRTPVGEVLTVSQVIPKSLYTQCASIRFFQYSVVTDTCEKDVAVRNGQVEIFREIAHYINKALIFTKVEGDRVVKEYCITATGCCEMREVKTRTSSYWKVAKVPFTKIKVDVDCTLHALDCSLDVMLKSASFGQALRGSVVCAQD